MYVREAVPDDNDELQKLQAQCPMGTNLIVSTVNTPDFFVRAKAYESSRVFVACEDSQIIGSAACTIRDAVVNGEMSCVGYEFQVFVSPDHRRKGIARLLHQHTEDYLNEQDAALSFIIIMEGNLPSMRLFEGQGFKRHRTLAMSMLAVYRMMDVPPGGKIRPAT
ncbi:MAG: GNAT family N-acetyltransferase, partial [Chloroflexota bacterium]